jgi:hypothetical protein
MSASPQVITLTDCCATTSAEGHDAATTGTFGMFSQPTTAADFHAQLSPPKSDTYPVAPAAPPSAPMSVTVPTTIKPSAQDMLDATLLYVRLKMDYITNPQLTSVDDLKYVLGEGGATEPWATLPGLRHKYFLYHDETQTCSGVYVFYNQPALDAYMASELFKAQGEYPHVSQVAYEVRVMTTPPSRRAVLETRSPLAAPCS